MGGRKEQFMRSAAIDSPPVQSSLRKRPRGPRRMQAEIGVADYSWHDEKAQKPGINEIEPTELFAQCDVKIADKSVYK